ncbi:MAG: flagellar export chaperone FlgN [bacterium]|nr:flagellar export chaperone FlgN [bacterium]
MILKSLIDNLKAQVEWHQLLHQVLVMEAQEIGPRSSLSDIEDVLSQRDRISERIQGLEQGRLKMVTAFIREHQLEPDSNLEAIAAKAPEAEAKLLKELKSSLLGLMEPIQAQARENARRAQNRANCFSEVSNSLHKTFKRQPTYSQYGKVNQPKGALFLEKSV